jgi:Alginate lyase
MVFMMSRTVYPREVGQLPCGDQVTTRLTVEPGDHMRRTSRLVAALLSAGVPLVAGLGGEVSLQQATRPAAFAAAAPTPDGAAPYLPGSAVRARSSVRARSGGPGAVPGAVSDARHPADLLDLRNWYLTLPTGNKGDPDTVEQPALATYSSSWFHFDDARDGVVFTVNAGGVTTKNSHYPRSELREMNGTGKAAWSNTGGTHTLEVRQAVLALPDAKPHVVTAQIHDASSDVMEVRLEGSHLIVQYDDGHENITVDPDYVLGTAYNLRIVAADGRIDVYYNDVRKAEIVQAGTGWYFKTGAYLQSNPEKGDRVDAISQVALYSLHVTHSG